MNTYSEAELVSFGNYLLKKCKVKAHNLEGEPVFNREVTDADFCNWKEEYPRKSWHLPLPSQFTIDDKVNLCLFPEGSQRESFPGFPASITAVHFTNSKVKYDLEIKFHGEYSTRIHNVDSVFVLPFKED